jgi:hypothetical protein
MKNKFYLIAKSLLLLILGLLIYPAILAARESKVELSFKSLNSHYYLIPKADL